MPDVPDVSAVHPAATTRTTALLAEAAAAWAADHPGDTDPVWFLAAARHAFDTATAPAGQLALVPAPTSLVLAEQTVVLGSDRDLAFVEFWAAYPRKIGKGAARKAWAAARRKGIAPEVLVAGARRYAADRAGADPQYTAHASTWLNAERWGDEPDPAHRPSVTQQGPPRSAAGRTMEAFRNVMAGREQPALGAAR